MENQPRVRFDSFLAGIAGSLTTALILCWIQSKSSSSSVTVDIIEEQELRGPGRREE